MNVTVLSKILTTSVLFLFIYGVQFTFLPTYTSRIITFIFYIYFLVAFYSRKRSKFPEVVIYLLYLFVFYLGWLGLSSFLSREVGTEIINHNLVFLFQAILGSLGICFWLSQKNYSFLDIVLAIQCAIAVQAIFILAYFVSWDFRTFSLTFIPVLSSNIDPEKSLQVSRGLTHSGGALLSTVQGTGILLSAYLLVEFKRLKNSFLEVYVIASSMLILVSILLSGRTGFLTIPIFFCYLLLSCISGKISWRYLLGVAVLLPLLAFAAYNGLEIAYQSVLGGWTTGWGEDGFSQLTRRFTDEFFSDEQYGSRTSQTLLESHWHFPNNFSTFIKGNPVDWNAANYQNIGSDIGVVRRFYATGLIGVSIFYYIIFYIFRHTYLSLSLRTDKNLIVMLSIWFFFIELKEPFLTKLDVAVIYMVLFFGAVFSSKYMSGRRAKANAG